MLIDWFTVGAQTLNFLILVWLLKRFLYQPILDAIDAREKRIAQELADAAKKQKEAKQERDDFNQKNTDFDQQRNALLQQATEAADSERQRLLDEARAAADEVTKKRKLALQREQKNFNEELNRLTRAQVFSITRKTLTDLSDENLESAIARVFIKRLRDLQGEAKSTFADAIRKANNTALIRSTFELPEVERADLQQAINETFSADIGLKFETAENTIGGLELSAEGQLIGWSIESYLNALEENMTQMLAATVSLQKKENAQ
jgi:F-type H+-transporting ATPase subunit b